jgi:glycosyltransferase involved in cell wall biosynthesis
MTKVSLIVPIYNEEKNLSRFLEIVDHLDFGNGISKEIILVNDGSHDQTKKILDDFPFKSEHVIIHKVQNCGKGAAIHTGIESSNGEVITIQDADFEYDIHDLPLVVFPIINGRADVVYGSRFKKTGEQVHRTYHYLINRFLTLLSNFFSGLYLTDMETCYKAFRSDLIKNVILESNRFGFEPEVTAKIAKLRIKMLEVSISYFPRKYSEGKKITWKDGVAAVRHIIYFNLPKKISDTFKPSLPSKYLPDSDHWL